MFKDIEKGVADALLHILRRTFRQNTADHIVHQSAIVREHPGKGLFRLLSEQSIPFFQGRFTSVVLF